MTIGCDTGFFVELIANHPTVRSLLEDSDNQFVASILSSYELRRLGLKGAVHKDTAFKVANRLSEFCTLVPLDDRTHLIEKAALLAHGTGLSMADSLIYTACSEHGARVIYTTDKDFEKIRANANIINLRST